MKKIIEYLNSFRKIDDSTKGYLLGMPADWLAIDKQKHAIVAFFLIPFLFFLPKEYIEMSDVVSILLATITMFCIGITWEYLQKITNTGEFDTKDATIMAFVVFLGSSVYSILRFYFYHPYI